MLKQFDWRIALMVACYLGTGVLIGLTVANPNTDTAVFWTALSAVGTFAAAWAALHIAGKDARRRDLEALELGKAVAARLNVPVLYVRSELTTSREALKGMGKDNAVAVMRAVISALDRLDFSVDDVALGRLVGLGDASGFRLATVISSIGAVRLILQKAVQEHPYQSDMASTHKRVTSAVFIIEETIDRLDILAKSFGDISDAHI